jgi:hypothetical protein
LNLMQWRIGVIVVTRKMIDLGARNKKIPNSRQFGIHLGNPGSPVPSLRSIRWNAFSDPACFEVLFEPSEQPRRLLPWRAHPLKETAR